MNKDEIKQALRTIGLYLLANHGCIAIDDGTEQSREIEWRIDNNKALEALDQLEKHHGVRPWSAGLGPGDSGGAGGL